MKTATTTTNTTLPSPVMTRKHFSERSGLRVTQIRSQANINNLPTFEVGRHKMINVAALVNVNEHTLYCPTATAAQFASWCGLTTEQVISQLSEGNLPVRPMGKLRLVDVAELYNRCLIAAGLNPPNSISA
ncbi:hypothetical protein [Gilvimarinus japonicus]|uniref:Uncharacterized protein n=1 Tax=Gilvimarinus japonicus TaxID=1796469 RepID=A0ABV7HRW3_9GAMM